MSGQPPDPSGPAPTTPQPAPSLLHRFRPLTSYVLLAALGVLGIGGAGVAGGMALEREISRPAIVQVIDSNKDGSGVYSLGEQTIIEHLNGNTTILPAKIIDPIGVTASGDINVETGSRGEEEETDFTRAEALAEELAAELEPILTDIATGQTPIESGTVEMRQAVERLRGQVSTGDEQEIQNAARAAESNGKSLGEKALELMIGELAKELAKRLFAFRLPASAPTSTPTPALASTPTLVPATTTP